MPDIARQVRNQRWGEGGGGVDTTNELWAHINGEYGKSVQCII